MTEDEAQAIVEEMEAEAKANRQRRYSRSALRPHRGALLQLQSSGLSYRRMAIWLERTHGVKRHWTSIENFLKKNPRMGGTEHAEL